MAHEVGDAGGSRAALDLKRRRHAHQLDLAVADVSGRRLHHRLRGLPRRAVPRLEPSIGEVRAWSPLSGVHAAACARARGEQQPADLADLAGDRRASPALREDSDPGPSPTQVRRASCRREPQKRPGRTIPGTIPFTMPTRRSRGVFQIRSEDSTCCSPIVRETRVPT